jgi:hypothetical protein
MGKGSIAWVSFTANIAWQIKILGPLSWIWYLFCLVLCCETASHSYHCIVFLLLFWEARDVNSIRKPKASLYGLQKTVEYFVTTLRNLHIKDGLNYVMKEKQPVKRREWFSGYHCFDTKKVVLDRFKTGQVLSCFVLSHNYDEVHVAYGDNAVHRGGGDDLAFASFTYSTHTLCCQESGVQFCKFTCSKKFTNAKKQELNITDYAIMLPYIQTKVGRYFRSSSL